MAALSQRHEDMVLYLLSLQGGYSPPLNLNARFVEESYPLLTLAADLGLV